MNKKISTKQKLLLGCALMAVGGIASATTAPAVDVSAATGGFEAVSTAVGEIGPLMLGAAAAGIVFKWVTAFLL